MSLQLENDQESGEGTFTGTAPVVTPPVSQDGLQLGLSLSPSEKATLEHHIDVPAWLSWFEFPFRVKSTESDKVLPEATGWAMDAAARGPLNLVGTYVGVALIVLASVDAGCTRVAGCEETIYGLKPSSMLTTVTAVVGVLAALFMPIVGAVVDRTTHRRRIGIVSAVILVIITGIQIAISKIDWFIILCLEAIGGFTLLIHGATVFSYLPDLAVCERDYVHYTARFNVVQFVSQTLFALVVSLTSRFTRQQGDPVGNALRTSRTASSVVFSMSLLLLGYAWTFSFRKRKALHNLEDGESLLLVGFTSVLKTSRKVFKEYKALKWLLIALLFSPEAGAGVISSIAVTFLQVKVQMTPLELSYVLLTILVTQIPGSLLSKFVCNRLNPMNSYRLALFSFTLSSALALTVTGPSRKSWVYFFAALWGISLGWIYTSQRVLFCTLIPKGQEFEFMGIFTFFGQILGWLPPVLFTVINEQGIDLQWGFALLPFFFFMALLCTAFMGSYAEAVALVSPEAVTIAPDGDASSSHMDRTDESGYPGTKPV